MQVPSGEDGTSGSSATSGTGRYFRSQWLTTGTGRYFRCKCFIREQQVLQEQWPTMEQQVHQEQVLPTGTAGTSGE